MPAWDSQYDNIKKQSENLTRMLADFDRTGGKGDKGTKGSKGSKGSKGAMGKFMSNSYNPKPKCGCCGKKTIHGTSVGTRTKLATFVPV